MSDASTDTEPDPHFTVPLDPLPCGSYRSKKRKSAPSTRNNSKSCKAGSLSGWADFLRKVTTQLGKSKSGCMFCSYKCFQILQPLLDEVKAWRDEMASAAHEVQDQELRWIFKPDPDSATMRPMQGRHSGDARQSCNDGEGSSTSTEKVDESDGEGSTSTSNPDNSDSGCGQEEHAPTVKSKSQQYTIRQGSKRPSVRIDTFLKGADRGMRICQKAAVLALGIGTTRLQRVTCQHLFHFFSCSVLCSEMLIV